MSDVVAWLPALVVLLACSAFFSGSEAAVFSLRPARVRRVARRSRSGAVVAALLARPRHLLVTILVGNLVVNVAATSATTAICIELFGRHGAGVAFVVMSTLLLTFGEILPKTLALRLGTRAATAVAWPLRAFHAVVWPVRAPLTLVGDAVIALLRRRFGNVSRSFTTDEIVTALRIARRAGEIDAFEAEVLGNILRFGDRLVREVMTPSIDVVSAPVDATRAELVERFARARKSRLPVWEGEPDRIIGILHVKSLVVPDAAGDPDDLRRRLHEPFFVHESMPITRLYRELQQRHLHVAVVLDEYSSLAGIVTLEDILEEVVGEIHDATDRRPSGAWRIDEREIVVPGTMELEAFNEAFDVHLEDPEHETLAGYLLGVTGRIPREGEVIDAEGLRFQIVSAEPNRIRKVRVEKP